MAAGPELSLELFFLQRYSWMNSALMPKGILKSGKSFAGTR
jgi:hypothetical protein